MTEVLFNIAGLRLPVVMTCANRAISAPINIWNDQQDAMTLRDAGWIMLFAENNQEAADLHIQAYKIAEQTNLPVMVCVDGFSLTHTFEPVEIREQKLVNKFLPKYNPSAGQFLDPQNPVTLGGLSSPGNYAPLREKLHDDLLASKKIIQKISAEFNKIFKPKTRISNLESRIYVDDGLIEYTGPKNPKLILIAMGSVLGTTRHALRSMVGHTGILKIKCFRPFPTEEISGIILKTKPKTVAVIDRAISLGQGGILAGEIRNLCPEKTVSSFILGLGGKDIRPEDIEKIVKNPRPQKFCAARFI
jgi:pyruvate ferredoxin oxidoreductase alpha subunit